MLRNDMSVRSRVAVLISERNTQRLTAGQKRITLREVAANSGVPLSVLHGLTTDNPEKRAKQVGLQTMDKLCRYFNCTPGELFEYLPDQ